MVYKKNKEQEDRKDAKKKYIIETAISVFSQKGYHHTSVKDIADEAGIAVGGIYLYFKGKEDLFASIYDEMAGMLLNLNQKVVDTTKFNTSKNFTRAITANLWVYQQKRELAKIALIEAIGLNPQFEKKRMENVHKGIESMAALFTSLKQKGLINIPEIDVAARIFEGSAYYMIIEWLESDNSYALTDMAYTLCIYNLKALSIDFLEEEIKKYIQEILNELSSGIL